MANHIDTIIVNLISRRLPSRGAGLDTDTWNSTIDEILADLSNISDELNLKIIPMLNTLPDGTDDADINAFGNYLDGANIYADNEATSISDDGYFWDTTDSRPSTIKESMLTIYDYVDAVKVYLENLINSGGGEDSGELTDAQKAAIGWHIFDVTKSSSSTSLDGKSEINRLNINQLALDIYGSTGTLKNDGTASLVNYDIKEMISALLTQHGGTWDSDITLIHLISNDDIVAGTGMSDPITASKVGITGLVDAWDGTPSNLNDDINNIRYKVKELKGTAAWTTALTPLYTGGADSLEDLLVSTKGTGTKSASNPWGYAYTDIEGLTAGVNVLGNIQLFTGQADATDFSPAYSTTHYVTNGTSLETAIGALDLGLYNVSTVTTSGLAAHLADLANPHHVTIPQVLAETADDVPATRVSIVDSGWYYSSSNAEGALQEIASGHQVHITDYTNPHNVTATQVDTEGGVNMIVTRINAGSGVIEAEHIVDHNSLDGLTGGALNDRYHVTSGQWQELTDLTILATITSSGISLASGATIDEFSTDGTLAGDSDSAVPTEKAVKTYVDAQIPDTHNDLVGLQGGQANEYYHLKSGEYTELNGWLDNVTLGTDGQMTLSGNSAAPYSINVVNTGSGVEAVAGLSVTNSNGLLGGVLGYPADHTSATFRDRVVLVSDGGAMGYDGNGILIDTEGSSQDIVFKQKDGGATYHDSLNATYSGVQLENGVRINEFSSDGTMAGNSDLAIPTEKAVVTYVTTSALAASAKSTVIPYVAYESVSAGDFVYSVSGQDDRVAVASADDIDTCDTTVGMALATVASGENINVCVEGLVTGLAGLTAGQVYYLAKDGTATLDISSYTAGDVSLRVGISKSTDEMAVRILTPTVI